jgi:YidC/Oxa1 family membrane protein insertase
MLIFANVIQTVFSPLIVAFESILVFLHDHVVAGSWGFAIVGLTLIVRAVMVPIGVKPLGAFMPLIAQAPVFVSLYYALRENLKLDICGEQLKHYFHVTSPSKIPSGKLQSVGCNHVARHSARFLFLGDITAPSTGLTLVVVMALYVASQMAAMLLGSPSAAPGSKAVMLALPFVFLLFIYSFPPGVVVYWITTNFWSAAQGYLIRRSIAAPLVVPALVDGSEARTGDPTVSGRRR